MKYKFYKYQGTGNDFILFDDRGDSMRFNAEEIVSICDRRFGIGADGVILLRNSPDLDFEMVYYNADGKPSSMCGNGGRCITSFAKKLGIIEDHADFLAADGKHEAIFTNSDPVVVKLKMKDVNEIVKLMDGWWLDTGSPHLVIEVNNLDELDVKSAGSEIRYNDYFRKEGVNVNFVQRSENGIAVRTYERGVEDETLSCGTGVTASALISLANEWVPSNMDPVTVNCPGGKLKVHSLKSPHGFNEVWLEGPAMLVFEGEISI